MIRDSFKEIVNDEHLLVVGMQIGLGIIGLGVIGLVVLLW
tara:strand:- start:97 stop:216 length:120 start_codon:yes stop_codon:yes gene_type:complete